MSNNDSHSVRRIVLPSGRSDRSRPVRRRAATTHGPARVPGLRVAPRPAARLERGRRRLLGAHAPVPELPLDGEGVFTTDQVDELEEQLDEGLADMLSTCGGSRRRT